MRLLTKKEKAMLLGEGYGGAAIRGFMQSISREDFLALGVRAEDDYDYHIERDASWVFENLILLYEGGMGNNRDDFGYIIHEFKDGARIAIKQDGKYYLVKDEEKTLVENFKHTRRGDREEKIYSYRGEDVEVGGYENLIRYVSKMINYRSEFVDKALRGLIKEEVYISGNDVFVPSSAEDSKYIVTLLAARNPKTIKGKQSNTHIFKDTGVTLKFLKEHSKEINSIFIRYGVKPKKSKLAISETDSLFNLYHNSSVALTEKPSTYNIYSM